MNDRDAALREVAALVSAALRNAHPSLEAQICPVAERLGLGPDATPEAAEMVLREGLGLKACECAIGGPGTVIPIACPVHGTPCDMCGRVESCTDDCGDDAAGSGYRTVDLIPDRYGRLVKVASTGTEVVIIPPPEANTLFFGAKQRDRFAKAIARALTPGQVPVEPRVYYACCIHCEHDGETDPDLDDERHPHPCREGCHTAVPGQAAGAEAEDCGCGLGAARCRAAEDGDFGG